VCITCVSCELFVVVWYDFIQTRRGFCCLLLMMSTVFVCGNLIVVLALQCSVDTIVLLLQWSLHLTVVCSTGMAVSILVGIPDIEFVNANLLHLVVVIVNA